MRLIQKWLSAGVQEDGKRIRSEVGTVQGGSISPLLANVYLHYVFDLWAQAWRNRIHAKHIDFVLCDPGNLQPILCIELDDPSHNRPDRIERDPQGIDRLRRRLHRHEEDRQHGPVGIAFDRDNGILYIIERRADEDKSLVHVFALR